MDEKVAWENELMSVALPRWDELPDIGIYMDQVLTYIDRLTHPLQVSVEDKKTSITQSMVNNYVKLGLMPKPIKKKYNKEHVARLIVISILKQVFDITSIKKGIELQVTASNSQVAYDAFCSDIEQTIQFIVGENRNYDTASKVLSVAPIQMASTALVAKLVTEKRLKMLLEAN